MGGKDRKSWLAAVKRAFSNPSKNSGKKTEVDDEEGRKKREKRRWCFHKSQSRELQVQVKPPRSPEKMYDNELAALRMAEEEAEVATASRVVVRFTLPSASLPREYYAAVIIQTMFRGYLARRALRALKGLVTLQALVRGSNVRRKTNMILQSMQAMVRVQAKFSGERIRPFPSHVATPCSGHKSSLSCADNFWDSRSMSGEGNMLAGDWHHRPRRLEQIQTKLNSRKDVALKREEADSYTFSYQSRRSDCNPHHEDEEPREMTWLDQWMTSRASFCNRSSGRASTYQPFSDTTPIRRQCYNHHVLSSPLHRSPATPSPSMSSRSPRLSVKLPSTPNYMAATESAMARLRSRSGSMQNPERERPASARKRLSFPSPEAHCNSSVWSPRYSMMTRQRSNVSSSVTESFGGEISPTSTADLRRWLR